MGSRYAFCFQIYTLVLPGVANWVHSSQRDGRSLKVTESCLVGRQALTVQLEAGIWGRAKLTDQSELYKSREGRVSGTNWWQLRLE